MANFVWRRDPLCRFCLGPAPRLLFTAAAAYQFVERAGLPAGYRAIYGDAYPCAVYYPAQRHFSVPGGGISL